VRDAAWMFLAVNGKLRPLMRPDSMLRQLPATT